MTETGAQDKEHKNKKQRLFFKSFSRKNSNQNAIVDVLIRDMEESSLEMQDHGLPKPVHKCGDCGGLGHHKLSKKCPKVKKVGKFIDMSTLKESYLNSTESETDCSVNSDVSEYIMGVDNISNIDVKVDDTIDDLELQEAVEDMAMDSPFKLSNMEVDNLDASNVLRGLF